MIDQLVGIQLKKLRERLGYSLEEVSTMTGVSRPSLSNIERGLTSTSINNLWKISKGLSIPISYFFTENTPRYEVITHDNMTPIASENDLVKIFTTFTWLPSDNFEVFYLELDPHAQRDSQAHAKSVSELILITEGELTMQFGQESITLSTQQLLRFNADNEHSYQNHSNKSCHFYSIMCYPTKGGL